LWQVSVKIKNGVQMILSFKDVQFIIEALEFRSEAYRERLKNEELDEDEVSDIGNDRYFLEALREDLMKAIKDGTLPKIAESSDGLYQEVRS
jgi:hypothetical protein